jgi:hypothetical protein
MIISKDINPERDVYYLGAKVIDILSVESNKEVNFLDVYEKLIVEEKISINLYSLTLDWLYLVGAIDGYQQGNILKCF